MCGVLCGPFCSPVLTLHVVQELIRSTAGAELCASHSKTDPKPHECAQAYDETYSGRVELSRSVRVGEPVQKSSLHWVVPYDVEDEAGNAAATVWRDVIVEEVDLIGVEAKIRKELLKRQEAEIQAAVDKALVEDRRKRGGGAGRKQSCPTCPKCDCSGSLDLTKCEAICSSRSETCAVNSESLFVRAWFALENVFPASIVPIILWCATAAFALLMLRWIATLVFNPQAYRRSYVANDERDRAMQNSVTYYSTDNNYSNGTNGAGLPPRSSLSVNPSLYGHGSPQPFSPPPRETPTGQSAVGADSYDSIYVQSPIITPSKQGNGIRQRSPYSSR